MIDNLQNKAREAVMVMNKSQEDAQTSTAQAEKAGEALNHIVSEISTITEMTTQIATAAHLSWRVRLRAYLDGKGGLSKDQAVSHKDCSLGKWYYATGLTELGHIPEMGELEQPHAELHRLISRIIELNESGRTADAENEYEKVDALSNQVVALLDHIQMNL